MINLSIKLNAEYLKKTAQGLKESLQRRILRRSLESGSQPLLRQLRAEIRAYKTENSTGVLGTSLGSVSRTNSKGDTSLRIGALRLPLKHVPLKQQRAKNRYYVFRKASRYFHLAAPGRNGRERVVRIFASRKHEVVFLIAQKFEELVDREIRRDVNL